MTFSNRPASASLPFIKTDFPLFLAPMAGVTDPIFRTICKELGVDVMVTEFVSAEGILQSWERNRRYTKIEDAHRPIGIQLLQKHFCRILALRDIRHRDHFIDRILF